MLVAIHQLLVLKPESCHAPFKLILKVCCVTHNWNIKKVGTYAKKYNCLLCSKFGNYINNVLFNMKCFNRRSFFLKVHVFSKKNSTHLWKANKGFWKFMDVKKRRFSQANHNYGNDFFLKKSTDLWIEKRSDCKFSATVSLNCFHIWICKKTKILLNRYFMWEFFFISTAIWINKQAWHIKCQTFKNDGRIDFHNFFLFKFTIFVFSY